MPYQLTQNFDGYRAVVRTDFSPEAMVYTSAMTMALESVLPPLTNGRFWGDVPSANVIVVGEDKHFVLVGAVTAFRSLTLLRAVCDTRRITAIEVYQPEIRQGEEPEKCVVLEGDDWRKLLIRYADIAAKEMGALPIDSAKNMTGYCTWYYYYQDVTEQHMLENIAALTANRKPYAAEYVQIDDGYQCFQGDWLDQCDTWPVPLEQVAKKIIDGGMKAGIWVMPTTASTASRVYREHPEWFVKNDHGETLTLPGWSPEPDHIWCCIDATLPAVQEHIARIFKTFRSWGFTYFKLDGLYFGLQRGRRHDANATSVSALRTLLKVIREAVPDAVLLGCSEPMLACIGLVDNARSSGDTSRSFIDKRDWINGVRRPLCSIADAFHCTMANFWWFDRWFRADPDVVMARQDNAFYTRNQAKISVLGAIMTGVALTSDHLGTISPDRNALLAKAQDIRMRDVMPMVTSEPYVWPMAFEGTIQGKRAVAVVNDTPEVRSWRLSELGMTDRCFDLLDEKPVFSEVTLHGEDAVLLVER